jgi:hypothetical protein
MIVLALTAAATIMVLSLAAIGAQLAAKTAVAQHKTSHSTSAPHVTQSSKPSTQPSVAPASDDAIRAVYSNSFLVSQLSSGGSEPVFFITIGTDDNDITSAAINVGLKKLKALSGVDNVTLVFTYKDNPYDTKALAKLVPHSTAEENQLIVDLR